MDLDNPAYKKLVMMESIPPLPATASALLAMAADPEVEIEALAGVIERDPGLTARLIGIANSAFYAPAQPVTTVKAAMVQVLGLNLVRNMAFGMAVAGGLPVASCPGFDVTSYWLMALGSADLASGLAKDSADSDAPDPDSAYLVGLLHNLGELLLVYLWPQKMDRLLGQVAADPSVDLCAAERAAIGVDHWAAGAFLCSHWQLPSIVTASIEGLAEQPGSDESPMVQLLRGARSWVAEVVGGQPGTLRVAGVDEAYCDYRSSAFVSRFDALKALARSMAT